MNILKDVYYWARGKGEAAVDGNGNFSVKIGEKRLTVESEPQTKIYNPETNKEGPALRVSMESSDSRYNHSRNTLVAEDSPLGLAIEKARSGKVVTAKEGAVLLEAYTDHWNEGTYTGGQRPISSEELKR